MPEVMDTTRDPVCGMTVEKADAEYSSEFDGTTYHFCSVECKDKFDSAPQSYLDKAA